MIRRLLTCLLLCPTLALAQNLPALYDVNGVASSDTLNVRAGPSTEFEILDKLAPDAEGLEVVDLDKSGTWGLVNIAEQSGWVSMRFMRRQTGQPDTGLPRSFSCYGTEPFWSFTVAQDLSARFKEFETETNISDLVVVPSQNRTDRHALFGDAGDRIFTTVVGHNQCTDGMTDRVYGLSIDLLVTGETGVNVYSGCCSVDR